MTKNSRDGIDLALAAVAAFIGFVLGINALCWSPAAVAAIAWAWMAFRFARRCVKRVENR